jgi:Tfp pilus assembly protein PilN
MQTLRVNLLPPEILERRRWERFYPYVFLAFVVLVGILLVTAAVLFLSAQQRAGELQQIEDQAAQVRKQAEAYSIFETDEQNLVKRGTVADKALASRVKMGKLAEELSLILPDEIWLSTLSASEIDGLSMTGFTPLRSKISIDTGYDSVAKLLVRLNTLPDLRDAWLNSAEANMFAGWKSATRSDFGTGTPTIQFNVNAGIRTPQSAPAAGSSVPAPPSSAAPAAN